jgi:type III secretion protein R
MRVQTAISGASLVLLYPSIVAASGPVAVTQSGSLAAPSVMLMTLAALALMPFVVMMATSFVKISVVLSIVRNAVGTQQVPPAAVITGLSVVLTMYVMAPVADEMIAGVRSTFAAESREFSPGSVDDLVKAAGAAKDPLVRFLRANAGEMELSMLERMAAERWKGRTVSRDDLVVLIPAFVLSQLREGFRLGFCVYIPFLVVDLVVVNALLALGMSMLQPSVISVPVKILVFMAADGWALLARGLVESFRG